MTTPATTPCARVTVTGHAAAGVSELLELCEQFLRTAGPGTRDELTEFLRARPTEHGAAPDPGWLIDMLGFNALYLQGKLALALADTHTNQTGDQT